MAERPGMLRVLVCGADHAALAVSLAQSGCPVVLLERDPHDRARLSDLLSRGAPVPALAITGDPGMAASCDMALAGGEVTVPPLPRDLPVLSLDWTSAMSATALQLSALPGRPRLLEILGPDRRGLTLALGRVLGAELLRLPRGVVPPSQRLLAVTSAEVEALALAGATPEGVDEAMEAAGFAPGPFELQDLLGIDTCLVARRAVFSRHPGPPELPLFARAVAEGRLGRKVGVGWYRYPGGGGKVEDPLIEDMAVEEARFAGMSRTDPDAETVRRRVIGALRSEAARIAAEGAASAQAVDRVAQLALGSPEGLLA